ncbi:MAG: hypothetical protein LBU89_01100 [Fibromonadaceae bacterium]|jgi:hypothetical protein|nr:hypothetical protein [Fibromonadaceae bacterium]
MVKTIKFATIAAMLLLLAFGTLSCKGNVKLLETTTAKGMDGYEAVAEAITHDPDLNVSGTDEDGDLSRPDNEKLEFVHNVEFNNETIPILGYVTSISDNGYRLDSLVFTYDGKKQIVHFQFTEEKELRYHGYSHDNLHILGSNYIGIDDINFDGYMDLIIEADYGGDNIYHVFYLYNPQTKVFYYHKELNQMTGFQTDYEAQTVTSYGVGDAEGKTYWKSVYKWVNGQLTLINSDNREYDYDLERYIRTTRTLQDDGKWLQHADTIKAGDL